MISPLIITNRLIVSSTQFSCHRESVRPDRRLVTFLPSAPEAVFSKIALSSSNKFVLETSFCFSSESHPQKFMTHKFMTNRSGDPHPFFSFSFPDFFPFFFLFFFPFCILFSLPVLVGLGQAWEDKAMTFDKTWQLALLGSNRFSGNFAGLLDWTVHNPESPRKVFPSEFPVGANRVGSACFWVNERISEAAFPVVSQSEHGLQVSTHQNLGHFVRHN